MAARRWASWLGWGGSLLLVSYQFYLHAPDAYMDEPFHIRQTQRYCQGDLTWDTKISTPPGLYVTAAALGQILPKICTSVTYMRILSNIALLVLPVIMGKVRRQLVGSDDDPFVIAFFPLLYFYGFLYYNDVLSVILVLASAQLSLTGRHAAAVICGFASVTVRQTNLLWILAYGAIGVLKQLEPSGLVYNPRRLHDITSALQSLASTVQVVFARPALVTKLIWPYVLLVGGCLAFVVIANEGNISFGDSEHHRVSLHIPQFLYWGLFTTVTWVPFVHERVRGGSKLFWVWVVAMTIFALLSFEKLSYVHEFILADNRHYVFYVWKRFLSKRWIRNSLAPVVPFAFAQGGKVLMESRQVPFLTAFILVSSAFVSLVSTPLLEVRYWILPWLSLRLLLPHRGEKIEWVVWGAVNVSTIAIFLKGFTTPEGVQRFMY